MNSIADVRCLLGNWFDAEVSRIRFGAPAHIHSDELIRLCGSDDQDILAFMWKAYMEIIDLMGNRSIDYSPSLHIALKMSETLDTVAPSLERLGELLSSEPPSIYVGKRLALTFADYEGYQIPLTTIPPFATHRPNVRFFYRCARGSDAIHWGWEFSRCIDAEYFPDSLRDAAPQIKGTK